MHSTIKIYVVQIYVTGIIRINWAVTMYMYATMHIHTCTAVGWCLCELELVTCNS